MKKKELLKNLKEELKKEFLDDLLPYWTEFAVDEKNGGFVGRATHYSEKVYDADKGGILNARLVWAFSALYKEFRLPELERAAKRAYTYFTKYFLDTEYGGFYWMTDPQGRMIDGRKHIYAQAFSIYGLIEYYSAFGSDEALILSQKTYSLIEEKAFDTVNGGYFEAYNRKWGPIDDVRLSDKDKNAPKGMNTHLHILEAYTALYRYAPEEGVRLKLESLLNIFFDHIVNKQGTSLNNFMEVDWTPSSDLISYGHNIEAGWLMCEAAEVLGDQDLLTKARNIAVSIADHVCENAIDPDGALINEADSKGIHDPNKDWWPQAEAIVGFINAWEITHDDKYLEAAWNVWKAIKAMFIDRENGEWHEKVSRDGKPFIMDKIRSWKAPYHNGRTILEVIRRADKVLSQKKVLEG